MKQTVAVLLAVCSLFATFALAQKNEITGVVGRTFVSDQGIIGSTSFDTKVHFGKGTTFEINYSRRFLSSDLWSLAFEVPFVFPDVAFSPWASVGGGFAHFGESSTTVFGLKNTGSTGTTSGVLQLGAGFDVKLIKALRLRFEVRDFWSGVPQLNVDTGKNRQHNIFVGGGAFWRF